MSRTPKTKEPELCFVPEKGTTYWYIRGCMQTHRFKVCETEFFGGIGDMLRLAKGNYYSSIEEAEKIAFLMNDRLDELNNVVEERKMVIEREKERERVKAELAKKKDTKSLTPPKKEKPPVGPKPKKEKPVEPEPKKKRHPDILD